jgi:hypothetical protein
MSPRTIIEVIWILLIVNVFVFALLFAFRRGYSLYLFSLTSDFIHWQDLFERCKPGDVVCFARTYDPSLKTTLDRMGSVASLRTDVFHAGMKNTFSTSDQITILKTFPASLADSFIPIPTS